MYRTDISDRLIHFTKGQTLEEAYLALREIIATRTLRGGTGFIRGSYKCVCFTEAPRNCLAGGLVNESLYSKYSPFGVMFAKSEIFSRGGRPAIYQPYEEYDQLGESHKWRHVTLNLRPDVKIIDHSWEREWRICTSELIFDESTAAIIVKDHSWAERLVHDLKEDVFDTVMMYSMIMNSHAQQWYGSEPQWHIITLR